MASKLQAGAATSNITPRLGVSINGGMQDRLATHVHDELHARCLVLDDGKSRIALVVCDSCMIPGDVLDAAKHLAHGQTGLSPDRILISATHTHSAPSSASVFQSDADEGYQEFLAERIADGIRRATNNLAPAKIAYGVGREPTMVFNRRWKMAEEFALSNPFGQVDRVKMNPPVGSQSLVEPAGPIDPDVTILSVQSADGQPLALFANYSLHYVGGVPGGTISADYYGVFADRMSQLIGADRLDPPFVAMMTNGTSGDINNVNFRMAWDKQPPYGQMRLVAYKLAEEAHRVYQGLVYRDDLTLAMREARLELGVRKPGPDDVARARFILSQGNGMQLKKVEEIYARETILMADYPQRIDTKLQAIRIGDFGIATIPCEVFVQIGLALKQNSPLKPTCVVSLANDYRGYLPTPEQHALGGYETWRARSSFLEVDASTKIEAKLLELLGEVAK